MTNPDPIQLFNSTPGAPVLRVTSRRLAIETGHKLPLVWHRPGSLREQMSFLLAKLTVATGSEEDQSLLLKNWSDQRLAYQEAKRLKIKVRTQKIHEVGIRLWRIK